MLGGAAAVLSILVDANTGPAMAKMQSVNKQLNEVDAKANKSGKSMGKFGGLAKAGGIAAAAGIAGAAVAIKGFVDAAKESEKSQLRMETQLKSLGISYGSHSKKIDDVISKQSKLAALDDEDLADSFTNLVRVTKDVNKALDLNGIAADLARGKNISLDAATKVVTKAQMGQVAALKKVGIAMEPVQENQNKVTEEINKYLAAGTKITPAMKLELDQKMKIAKELDKEATKLAAVNEVRKTFAGQAEKYGESAAGAQERFGVAIENLQEKLGEKLLPILTKVMMAVTKFIEDIESGSGSAGKFADVVVRAFHYISPVIDAFINQIESMVKVVRGIVTVFAGLLQGDFSKMWEGIKLIFGGAIDSILNSLKLFSLPFRAVGKLLLDALVDGITTVTDALTGIGGWVKNRVVEAVQTYLQAYGAVGGWVLDKIVDGFKAVTDALGSIGGWLLNRIRDGIQTYIETYANIGGWIIDKIVGGIKGSFDAIKDAAKWLKDKVVEAVKDFFGISSPSKVMMELGGHLASGLIKGVVGGDIGGFIKAHLGSVAGLATGALGAVAGAVKGALGIGKNVQNDLGGLMQLATLSGLGITSTTGGTHAKGSYHYQGRAFDTAGSADEMMEFARKMLSIAPKLTELFYDPLGVYVKNGKIIQGAFGGHGDHVHVALAQGGIVTRPTTALIGERGPEAVIPLNGRHGFGGTNVTVIVQGNAWGNEDLAKTVAYEFDKMVSRQGNFGVRTSSN
jgi:hypothetical protein